MLFLQNKKQSFKELRIDGQSNQKSSQVKIGQEFWNNCFWKQLFLQ